MPDRLGEDVFRAKRREDVSRERREDEEEWLREMRKPAAIQEDLWEMGRRRRVQQVLGARDFCSELEQVIQHDFAKSFPEALNNSAQPQMPMVNPQQLPVLPPLNVNQVLQTPPIPIADLADRCYSREEAVCRNKLATLYRLVDIFRWSQGIYNHITLRLPDTEPAEILINPFGLLYHEITASSLIKLTLEGRVLDQGDTHLGVNQAAYVLHSAIHEARPDVHCVLHLHTAVVAAIGSMKCGLLPLCQEAMIIGPVAYHDYQGILTDEAEKKSIVADLGDKNVMILRNHGFVVCGQSVEDTLHLAFHTIIACETQIRAARVGLDHLVVPSDEAALKAYRTARRGGKWRGWANKTGESTGGGVNRVEQNGAGGGHGTAAPPVWGIGELEWEAWCRVLDTAGYQTGQRYRQPQLLGQQLRRIALHQHHHSMHNLSSVATPSNGPGSVGEADEQQTGGLAAVRLAALRSRAKWLNSPNQYQKVHLLETGSTDHRPKVVTKWVQQCDSASTGGTPVKIHSPHQFSPCSSSGAGSGSDPREFRERQRRMKEVRLSGTISPGPVAHVLNAPTMGTESEGTEQRVSRADGGPVYIGTASKGIIDRAHQHNAQVYRRLYAPNPFAGGTDEALQQYLHDIQKSKSTPALSGALNADSREPTSSSPLQPQSPTIVTRDPPDSPSSYAIDGVSLMQAVKRAKMNGHSGRSASGDGLDSPPREERATANGNGLAERAKSGEKQQTGVMDAPKKKKRGIFASFGRRKKSGDARK